MFTPRTSLDSKAVLLLVMLCASWGLQQVLVKLALPSFPPVTQTALRSAIAAVIVIAVALRRPSAGLLVRDGTGWWGILAGVLFASEFALLNVGLQWTDASRGSVLLYTAPLMVALGATWLLPAERLTAIQWGGLIVTFLGVAVVMGTGVASGGHGASTLAGDLLTLLGAAGWAATTLIIKTTPLRRASPEKILVYQLLVSAIVLGIGAIAVGERVVWPVAPVALASLAFQAVWIASFTYLLWFGLLSAYPASRLQGATSMTPLFGVLAAVLVLGEPLRPSFGLAVVLVVAGLILLNVGPALLRRKS